MSVASSSVLGAGDIGILPDGSFSGVHATRPEPRGALDLGNYDP